MASKRTFTMNGNTYTSMMEIARELGIKRVYPRDFAKYGIVETTDAVAADATNKVEDKKVADIPQDADTAVSTENTKAENDIVVDDKEATDDVVNKEESQVAKKTANNKNTAKAAAKPASNKVKSLTGLEAYSAELRVMTLDDLVNLAKKEQVELYETVSDEKIRRMRLTMALKSKKYPGQKLNTRKASFRHVSLDDLKEFAKEVGVVDYTVTSEERTQKMWIIHALNKAGYYDIPEKKDEVVNA